jgi:hypothetical protein
VSTLAKSKSSGAGGGMSNSYSGLFRVASSNKQLNLTIPGKDEPDDPKEIAKKNGMI